MKPLNWFAARWNLMSMNKRASHLKMKIGGLKTSTKSESRLQNMQITHRGQKVKHLFEFIS